MTTTTDSQPYNKGLFRYAITVVVWTLLLILSGACITSSQEQLAAGDQSSNGGSATASFDFAFAPRLHMLLAALVSLLMIGLVIWLLKAQKRNILRILGVAAIVLLAVEGATAGRGVPPLSAGMGILHAVCAPLFLSVLVMIALFTSRGRAQAPEVISTGNRNWLPTLAVLTPFMVLLQVTLGALYRHNEASVLWHMGGALVAVIMILVVTMTILQHFADHRVLHAAAVWLLAIVLTQITLGIFTFVIKLLNFENTLGFLLFSVFHVLVGSLTLAASIVMAFQAKRNFAG